MSIFINRAERLSEALVWLLTYLYHFRIFSHYTRVQKYDNSENDQTLKEIEIVKTFISNQQWFAFNEPLKSYVHFQRRIIFRKSLPSHWTFIKKSSIAKFPRFFLIHLTQNMMKRNIKHQLIFCVVDNKRIKKIKR